ncbi:MAG: tetratricopeptide repeat protein [Chloroflexota bacterium]|nr:tetratricopeptide repeat protein [Chloroflexota bacterium]
MAKKLSKRQSRKFKLQRARERENISLLLKEAMRVLRRGNTDRALQLSTEALQLAEMAEEERAARQTLAETRFRAAIQGPEGTRVSQLEQALELVPDDSRIRFHYAVALWRTGRLAEAAAQLERVAKDDPERPRLAYLRQLARVAQGKSWSDEGLSASEANTLGVVEQMLHGKKGEVLPLDTSLLGAPQVWQALHSMQRDPDAAPIGTVQQEAEATKDRNVRALLRYYQGVAAVRAGNLEAARQAWIEAQGDGLDTSWLNDNLAYLLRARAIELAQQEQWQRIADLAKRAPNEIDDRILAQTVGLAYFHLGYRSAQASQWQRAAQHWRRAERHMSNRHLAQNLALAEEALENWARAAESWRDMVRRRPRSETHPDYLDDHQVAAIWRHAAHCYREANNVADAIACMKNAIKYAPEDVEFRRELAEDLLWNDQIEAAQNELNRVLEIDPNDVEALVKLASIATELGMWRGNPLPLWKRVLEIDPNHKEAQDGLALAYLEKMRWLGPWSGGQAVVEEALEALPNHPKVLIAAGAYYQREGKNQKARDLYLRAYDVAPEDVQVVGVVLHELLHLEDEGRVEAMILRAREIPRLLPAFWWAQSERALQCNLDVEWVMRFSDEAIEMAGQPYVEESQATLLMTAYDTLGPDGPEELKAYYADRIRKEAPDSGGVEFMEALEALAAEDTRKAQRLFKQAKRKARRAKDQSAVDYIQESEDFAFMRGRGLLPGDILGRLMEMFPDGPPTPEELDDILGDDYFI